MTVAFDLLLKILRKTGKLYEGDGYACAATVGTTSTVICTNLTQIDDYWKNGIVGILHDAAGASAAPEKESRDISGFTATSDTVAVYSPFSVAPASGDTFFITRKLANGIGKATLLACLDEALRWYGKAPHEDTSLTTAYNTQQYTLPVGVDETTLFQVWLATQTADPYQYVQINEWHVDLENRQLIFDYFPPYPYQLKLISIVNPTAITADNIAVSSWYQPDALVEYAYAAYQERRVPTLSGTSRANAQQELNFALQLAEKLKTEHPLPSRLLQRAPKYGQWQSAALGQNEVLRVRMPGLTDSRAGTGGGDD